MNSGLEGLCANGARGGPRIRLGVDADGMSRLEAYFPGEAYSLHRHDTYAIGITLSGIQSFRYRGALRRALPGQCHVLHPDEPHDGAPGTDEGFGYRIVYIDPSRIQQALGGRPLPFVGEPVFDCTARWKRLFASVWEMREETDELERTEILVEIADALRSASRNSEDRQVALPLETLNRVRDVLGAFPYRRLAISELEIVADLDRWTLARQFRSAFGTSPSRFRTMRQLDLTRALVREGESLAEAALEAGFADQSHMSRMFKRAYGITPGRWTAALV